MARILGCTLRATGLVLTLACLLMLANSPRPLLAAEEGAHGNEHGGPAQPENGSNNDSARPAVSAPRVTERWSAKGMAENPIALGFDYQGNLYVVQAYRAGQAVLDQRWDGLRKNDGITDDLQKTSVEDRLAEIERLIANGTFKREDFTGPSDQISFLSDSDGDGVADKAHVFAGSFNDELDGIAAGVLWLDGKVYLTNIPHLWLLQDKDGDGDADEETEGERVSLSYGYGIRWAFYGHDMHGLVLGPDGRIYFSMADRGYNVMTKEGKHLYGPDRGAVFRMWPDGSELELFHQGLRNPQELAFDNYGNLFTGDNNCDAGDRARFTYLPEGGDSGWRQDVQSLPSRGPWLREKMWEPRRAKDDPTQPAWIIPPLANVGAGPSGLAHYPGTGDVFESNGSFLMCDFPAGVRHVQTRPNGAWFKVVEDSSFLHGKGITDITWGYDGRLYLSDWGGGWRYNPNGYIFTMTNKAAHAEQAQIIPEIQSLFKGGFDALAEPKLIELLGHRDQRVRLAAQYELSKRANVAQALGDVASSADASQLARVHAVWTLSMIARKDPIVAERIAALLDDQDPQVRTQAAKMLADLRFEATDRYIAMLKDDFAQARFYAAMALGKTHAAEAVEPLLTLLEDNANEDPVLRHGGAYALYQIAQGGKVKPSQIVEAAAARSAAARLGVVLALRHLKSPLLAEYLDDADVLVVADAARAIYDMRVMDAYEPLAAMLDGEMPQQVMIEPVLRRVIEANVRLGGEASANRLAKLAADADAHPQWRTLALDELAGWSELRNREGVWGSWWPRNAQSQNPATKALSSQMSSIIESARGGVQTRARELDIRLLQPVDVVSFEQVSLSKEEPAPVRIAALDRLARSDGGVASEVCKAVAEQDGTPDEVKNHARAVLGQLNAAAAVASYVQALEVGSLIERQEAVQKLAGFDAPEAQQALGELGRKLVLGTVDPEIRLDVFEALRGSDDLQLKNRAMQYDQANRLADQPWIRDTLLAGGDIERGKQVFLHQEVAECQRCHIVGGTDVTVGPNLSTIGSHHTVEYLYQALINPSADIAKGFESVSLTLGTGETVSGRIARREPTKIVLMDAEGKEQEYMVTQITGMTTSEQSQMPTMGDKLTAAEARDVLAYLVSLQDPKLGPAKSSGVDIHAAGFDGPIHELVNPVTIDHKIVLPAFMLSVCILLGVLFLVTALAGGRRV